MPTYLIKCILRPDHVSSPSASPVSPPLLKALQSLSTRKTTQHLLCGRNNAAPDHIGILLEAEGEINSANMGLLNQCTIQPPTLTTLDYYLPLANLPNSFVDIVTLKFPSQPDEDFRKLFQGVVSNLLTDIREAKLAGRGNDPCWWHCCVFGGDKACIWALWKDMERREEFIRGRVGRTHLRIVRAGTWRDCDWESMGEGLWEPLVWWGARAEEEGCWVFEKADLEKERWGLWERCVMM